MPSGFLIHTILIAGPGNTTVYPRKDYQPDQKATDEGWVPCMEAYFLLVVRGAERDQRDLNPVISELPKDRVILEAIINLLNQSRRDGVNGFVQKEWFQFTWENGYVEGVLLNHTT